MEPLLKPVQAAEEIGEIESKRTWFFVILGVCVLILLFAGSSGLADAIRTILHGVLNLLGAIARDLVGLIGQLIDKIGK